MTGPLRAKKGRQEAEEALQGLVTCLAKQPGGLEHSDHHQSLEFVIEGRGAAQWELRCSTTPHPDCEVGEAVELWGEVGSVRALLYGKQLSKGLTQLACRRPGYLHVALVLLGLEGRTVAAVRSVRVFIVEAGIKVEGEGEGEGEGAEGGWCSGRALNVEEIQQVNQIRPRPNRKVAHQGFTPAVRATC
jgi:hypothetical protein